LQDLFLNGLTIAKAKEMGMLDRREIIGCAAAAALGQWTRGLAGTGAGGEFARYRATWDLGSGDLVRLVS
jgi:hypothetical protein